jgi:hypothetical protein
VDRHPRGAECELKARGIRDTARVLRLSPATGLRGLRKKAAALASVHTALLRTVPLDEMLVDMQQAGEAEGDAMGSFVGKQGSQRRRWHAMDHPTGVV